MDLFFFGNFVVVRIVFFRVGGWVELIYGLFGVSNNDCLIIWSLLIVWKGNLMEEDCFWYFF